MFPRWRADDPCYRNGYARNAGESIAPGLWEGLRVAYVPQFGYAYPYLPNVAHRWSGDASDSTVAEGSIVAGDPWRWGEIGAYLDLTSSYVATPTNAEPVPMQVGTEGFSFFLRAMLPSGANTGGVFSIGDSETNSTPSILLYRSTETTVRVYFSGAYRYDFTVEPLEWIHLGVTYDDFTAEFNAALNGVVQSPVSIGSYANFHALNRLYIGTGFGGFTDIAMAEFCAWDRALNVNEIGEIYADGLRPFRKRPRSLARVAAPSFNAALARVTNVAGVFQAC